MKKVKLVLVTTFAMLFCIVAGAQTVTDSVRISGKMRTFKMVIPKDMKPGAPLVVLLHGYGGGDFDAPTCMDDVARAHGFALCVPQGLTDPNHERSWNVGYPMQNGWDVDDVEGICKLTRAVQRKYSLSKANVFLTGMSNGGEMCYLMLYRNKTLFKAIASVAGLTLEWMYKGLMPKVQVPFMEIHGTEDRVSEWTGDLANKGGWGAYMPVPIAVGRIVALNRCTHETVERIESLNHTNGHYIMKHSFLGGDNGCDVFLYEVVGASHCWHIGDMNTGDEVWHFFARYLQ